MIIIELFILGIVIGSFLNVLIYRIPNNIGMEGRSKCPICKTQIKWYHNIPIFSWILLKGKCAYCGTKIHYSYALVELLSGILILIVANKYGFDITNKYFWIEYLIYTGLLTLSVIDFKYKAIPDIISLPTLYLSIWLLTKNYDIISSIQLVLIIIGGTLLFKYTIELIFNKEMLGEGDIIIAGIMIGILNNYQFFYIAIYITAIIILVEFFIRVLIKKESMKETQIPFIPYLFLGTLISEEFGLKIINIIY